MSIVTAFILHKLRADGWDVLTVWECETRNAEALQRRLRTFLDALTRRGAGSETVCPGLTSQSTDWYVDSLGLGLRLPSGLTVRPTAARSYRLRIQVPADDSRRRCDASAV